LLKFGLRREREVLAFIALNKQRLIVFEMQSQKNVLSFFILAYRLLKAVTIDSPDQ
jgi:hypothetical protein